MQELLAQEINSRVQFYAVNHIHVWLGDYDNGIDELAVFSLDQQQEAARWLDMKAREYYPDSKYASGIWMPPRSR